MITKTIKKTYISETNIEHEIEMNPDSTIVVWVYSNKIIAEGYEFPVINGKINWDHQKESWALLSNDVVKVSNDFAKACHLIAFS